MGGGHLPITLSVRLDLCLVELGCDNILNTPGTAGGPGGRDRTLAVAKNRAKITFFFWG